MKDIKQAEMRSTLEVQQRIFENKLNKGFNVTDINKEFCLLYGEVGEAYDAWRKKKETIGEELADVAIYLLGLAQILGVDLACEINSKMLTNENRKYSLVNGVRLKEDINVTEDVPSSAQMRDYFADGMK